ncbi:Slp family lipoprotein [uncultured Paraglaciecola sp.]|uniref:Slp family lipoprotein n=1 Tax=uncultured Paraglaciecola sp. TaxID=1765024 RepID=UPI002626F4CD|nr:Slp family lipoprotein [uncultured Paraglaciecola sp.]
MNIRICALLSALFLAGCSTFPEKLKLEDNTQLVTYENARSNAEQTKGKLLRWGGAIAKVENKPDSTIFEMVSYPLTSYGRPRTNEESMGRFRISVKGFLDPMVYQVGRLMTFTAQLNGLEKGLVGEHEYTFPTAMVKGYYLWKNVQRIEVNNLHVWPSHHMYYPRYYRRNVTYRNTHRNSGKMSKPSRPSRATNYAKPVTTKRIKK